MIDYGTEYLDPSVTPTVKYIVSLNKNTENHILTSVTRGTSITSQNNINVRVSNINYIDAWK